MPSHLAVMISVSEELRARGHRVTFINVPDAEAVVRAHGFDFAVVGADTDPVGSVPAFLEKMGQLKGLESMFFQLRAGVRSATVLLEQAPALIRSLQMDALLVDQGDPSGSTLSEYCGIPFVTICSAAPMARFADVPPTITPWPYGSSAWRRLRNRACFAFMDFGLRPITRTVNAFRHKWGLRTIKSLADTFSPLIQVSQLTSDFDFVSRLAPQHFHYVGLFEKKAVASIPFPFEKLTGKPLIYVSFGTILTSTEQLFDRIVAACAGLDVQLVFTRGGGASAWQPSTSNGCEALVVDYAPQMELLKRANLTICHGGANTTLESLSCGVPLIVIPITNDQPGMAARVRRYGAGENLPLRQTHTPRLRGCIRSILTEESYRARARQLQQSIRNAGGACRAAELILEVIESRLTIH